MVPATHWRLWLYLGLVCCLGADKPAAKTDPPVGGPSAKSPAEKLTPLNKQGTVLLDLAGKRLLLKGRTCLRQGTLELLCCLKQTKEHESIFSLDAKAYVVHTGLLALGAEQGKPAEFDPEFKPPTGQEIQIYVSWTDEKLKTHRVQAQQLIRYVTQRYFGEPLERLPPEIKLTERADELRYDPKHKELLWYGPMDEATRDRYLKQTKDADFKRCIESFYKRTQSRPMDARFVFSGSSYYIDEETKEKFYRGEDGDLICVANFNSATIDIASRSSNGAEELLFEAWTERLPEVDTPVTIELIPVFADDKKEAPAKPAEKSTKPAE